MNHLIQKTRFLNGLISCLIAYVLYRACGEFYHIAWGTGTAYGEFSRTWAVLYFCFVLFCISFFVLTTLLLWNQKFFLPLQQRTLEYRTKLGPLRWLLWFLILLAPLWFFQYTAWGVVFQRLYIRIFIWILVVCLLTILSSRDG